MEETLRDLELVMAAHREALAQMRAQQSPRRAAAPVVTSDPRALLMQALTQDIERVSGIEMTGMMTAKLNRVLSSVAPSELEAWVSTLRRLPPTHPEWLSLIEALTVHETFFHRDRAQLELLAKLLPELVADIAGAGRHKLRMWSAGCATGEEAYTLAILALLALRDAGHADDTTDGIVCHRPWSIDVLGTDISRLVLTQAKAAVYSTEGLSSFRDLPPMLQRFFPVMLRTRETGDIEIRGVVPAVRQHVRFEHFNLMSGAPPETGFDVVLCRNVLIYFTAEARFKAQLGLRRALRPGGILLLGPTDSLADADAYDLRWGPGAMAYVLKSTSHG